MNKPRTYVFFVAPWVLMAAVAGCGRSGTDASRSVTLAVIPKSTGGEFWETVEQGARAAAEDLGVAIRWEGTLTETELARQNRIVENMVNLGVDGMALAPLNNRVMRRSVENTVAAGIPVVIFDSAVDGDAHVSYVATDNRAGGALGAEHLIEQLGRRGSKRIFVLRYIQGTASTEQRTEGFIETIEAAGFEVLASPYSEDATVAGALRTATNSLERFIRDGRLDIDGIFATNLFSTQGMATALANLRQSGVAVDVVFVGFDTSPRLISDLQRGDIDALVSQNPRRMGYLAVETLVKHLRGEEVESVIDTGVELVTPERLENEPEIRRLVGLSR